MIQGREYHKMEKRDDLFAPLGGSDTSRLVDVIALRERWLTATADATNAFFHGVELEQSATTDVASKMRDVYLERTMAAITGSSSPHSSRKPSVWSDRQQHRRR